MLYIFSFQASEKSDLDILDFWLFDRIFYFGVVFDLVFKICINSCTYVFSNFNLSLIKILAIFFGMYILIDVVGRFYVCTRSSPVSIARKGQNKCIKLVFLIQQFRK